MKNWLSEETVAKINILGSDYLPFLLTLIDEENLPATLGGKCHCDCPGGCESSNVGPWKEDPVERAARRAKAVEDAAEAKATGPPSSRASTSVMSTPDLEPSNESQKETIGTTPAIQTSQGDDSSQAPESTTAVEPTQDVSPISTPPHVAVSA